RPRPTRGPAASCSRRWSRWARGSCSSGSIAPTGFCGRSLASRCSCRSSIARSPAHVTTGIARPPGPVPDRREILVKRFPILASFLLACALAPDARAFCGFFVATGDAKIFNKASKVVMVRDGDRTVLTLSNDFKGDFKEFAMVIPVPVVLQKGQIHVGDQAAIDHLDAFTAPRLVEYFDENPCAVAEREARMLKSMAAPRAVGMNARGGRADALGVRIEASYTVGEYDILILSATQSTGLETWLTQNGYRIPAGASRVLGVYIRQGLKFFVAKVNLKEQAGAGFQQLRPLQMAYGSPRFMLPIR